MNDVISKVRKNKTADRFNEATDTKTTGNLLNRTKSTSGQKEQPDVASLTKQTLHDIPKNMPPAKLQIRDLNFYYGDFKALKISISTSQIKK